MESSQEEELLIVTPGTPLIPATGFMQGHGTFISSTELPRPFLVANSLGQVERVNRLVSVKPIRTKYIADVGDLVVGSIVEVRMLSFFHVKQAKKHKSCFAVFSLHEKKPIWPLFMIYKAYILDKHVVSYDMWFLV